ncbi:hypothetical protein THAOC_33483, partial [Thalassiosira oceanica]
RRRPPEARPSDRPRATAPSVFGTPPIDAECLSSRGPPGAEASSVFGHDDRARACILVGRDGPRRRGRGNGTRCGLPGGRARPKDEAAPPAGGKDVRDRAEVRPTHVARRRGWTSLSGNEICAAKPEAGGAARRRERRAEAVFALRGRDPRRAGRPSEQREVLAGCPSPVVTSNVAVLHRGSRDGGAGRRHIAAGGGCVAMAACSTRREG